MHFSPAEYFQVTDSITAELFAKADCFPVAMRTLKALIETRGDNLNYLEFGTGRTCSAHKAASLPNVGSVISVDISTLDDRSCNRPLAKFVEYGGLPVDTPKGKWETKRDIIARLSNLPGQDKIKFWDNMDSNTLSPRDFLHVAPFDVIYIDGDHTAEGVINDWNIAKEIIKPNGIIIFDDWGDHNCPTVREGIKSTAAREYFNLFIDYGWHCAVDFRQI